VTTPPAAVSTTAPSPESLAPATTSAPVTTSAAATTTGSSVDPGTSEELAPSTTTSSTETSQTTTDGGTPTSPPAVQETTGSEQTSAEVTTSDAVSPTPTTTTLVAEQVAKIEEPERLQASAQDVDVAKASVPVQEDPNPAPQSEIDRLRNLLSNPVNPNVNAAPTVSAQTNRGSWDRTVRQWQPDWVQYDEFYRPVIFNPYREPLQIVYNYAGVPRVLVIPPLGSIVTEAAERGAYSFTAMLLNAVGIPTTVAVGSFFGGGYDPGPGLPPPPPPPPVVRYDDVPVVVKYTNAVYRPFRVQKIVDVGDDPRVGERKVLLDGVTPAWGVWKQTDTGERTFEVHKTQQFPGLDDPQEGPLPGDYQLQLASDSSSGLSTRDIFLIATAGLVAVLGLGAIVLTIVLGRRRPHH
jgi:hypothetical protein